MSNRLLPVSIEVGSGLGDSLVDFNGEQVRLLECLHQVLLMLSLLYVLDQDILGPASLVGKSHGVSVFVQVHAHDRPRHLVVDLVEPVASEESSDSRVDVGRKRQHNAESVEANDAEPVLDSGFLDLKGNVPAVVLLRRLVEHSEGLGLKVNFVLGLVQVSLLDGFIL